MDNSYIRFNFRADIWSRSSSVNAAGQKKHTWTSTSASVPCIFKDEMSTIRTEPTVETMATMKLIFPKTVSVNDSQRIYNIKDRMGNIIEPGPMEIIGVQSQQGFQGKNRSTTCLLRRVFE
jgi:hypothetical protein